LRVSPSECTPAGPTSPLPEQGVGSFVCGDCDNMAVSARWCDGPTPNRRHAGSRFARVAGGLRGGADPSLRGRRQRVTSRARFRHGTGGFVASPGPDPGEHEPEDGDATAESDSSRRLGGATGRTRPRQWTRAGGGDLPPEERKGARGSPPLRGGRTRRGGGAAG